MLTRQMIYSTLMGTKGLYLELGELEVQGLPRTLPPPSPDYYELNLMFAVFVHALKIRNRDVMVCNIHYYY
jgi:hypothetical protein